MARDLGICFGLKTTTPYAPASAEFHPVAAERTLYEELLRISREDAAATGRELREDRRELREDRQERRDDRQESAEPH
jgi:hypothetical protein